MKSGGARAEAEAGRRLLEHLLPQPGRVLQLLLQLLPQELTLRAGPLLLGRPLALPAVRAGQRHAPGVAVVAEAQLLLCCTQRKSVSALCGRYLAAVSTRANTRNPPGPPRTHGRPTRLRTCLRLCGVKDEGRADGWVGRLPEAEQGGDGVGLQLLAPSRRPGDLLKLTLLEMVLGGGDGDRRRQLSDNHRDE